MDATDQVVYKHCSVPGPGEAAKTAPAPAGGLGFWDQHPLIPSPKPEPEKRLQSPSIPQKSQSRVTPRPTLKSTKPSLPSASSSSRPTTAAAGPQPLSPSHPNRPTPGTATPSASQTPVPSSPLQISMTSLQNSLPPQLLQYQCDQCTVAFLPWNSGRSISTCTSWLLRTNSFTPRSWNGPWEHALHDIRP